MQKYEHEHTKAWSRLIASGDAYVFVTPEYNYSTPPSLSNALDYLVLEWSYKPLGFVSYGGVSGGLRGVQQTKLLAGALKMVPVPEAVSIPMFTDYIDGEGNFKAVAHHEHAAQTMLDEMLRWSGALQSLRS
jgi:NAD(P)H-dependent FMN reductase